MRSYDRLADVGESTGPTPATTEWEYVEARRRPGAPDGSLPVRALLIEEGVRVVDARGPQLISLAACGRGIGVSTGAPYVWFADAADFRSAVAASLISMLVSELIAGERQQAPVAQLTADVRIIVANWAGNGVGIGDLFATGGPASQAELTWARQRLLEHLADRVHAAAECTCRAGFGAPCVQRELVETVLAVCHGYAGLARAAEQDPDRFADAAAGAAIRLLGRPRPGDGPGRGANTG